MSDAPGDHFREWLYYSFANMYSYLAVVLLALGSAQAQMNQLCCPPNMTAMGYNALLDFQYHYYYDSESGDNLAESTDGHLVQKFESSSGRWYTRLGDSCTYIENQDAVGLNYCLAPGSKFIGAEDLEGVTYYEWEAVIGKFHGTLVVDDMCMTKIIHGRLNDQPFFSSVLFNLVHHGDVSRIHDFNTTDCILSLPS